nr:auxin-responsive protein SAUR21-like [Tanacetum cinerariifolium]
MTIRMPRIIHAKQMLRRSFSNGSSTTSVDIPKGYFAVYVGEEVDVRVTTAAEPPLLSATTLHQPSTPIITHLQQTPVPSPSNVPSSSMQDLPNFGSLFGFDQRQKALEDNFSEFMQTNQFAKAISLISGIVDKYLKNQMNEAVKVAVQLQSDRLRDEAQAQNEDFLNKIDENIKKIINDESKTSHAIAANLSELELKKILIDNMERNKTIYRSTEQKNLHKALVEAYESDKLILDTYGDTRRRDRKEPESTSAPKEKTSMSTGKSTEGSKSHHKSAPAEEPMHTAEDLEETKHQDFITAKPPTPDRDWNKTLPAQHRPVQPWISNLARKDNSRDSFNELMDTPLDFSSFMMNWLTVDTLTLELLTGTTFEPMKGSCKSLVELEYFFEEVYKATTDQLDWNNPEECEVKCRSAMTNMHSEESCIGGANVNSFMDLLLTRNLLEIDNDKLYKFKECDFNRLRIQDIKDMLLLFDQGKGFIYQNKDTKNRLMRIDELHKFSDGTLNDVQSALDDRLKGIRMQYLPQTIWRRSDKDKAGAMI